MQNSLVYVMMVAAGGRLTSAVIPYFKVNFSCIIATDYFLAVWRVWLHNLNYGDVYGNLLNGFCRDTFSLEFNARALTVARNKMIKDWLI